MNKRLNELRTTLNLSLEEFGKRLGVTRTAVYLWESGKRSISEQTIKLIIAVYNVNEDWLRNGTGSMFLESADAFFSRLQLNYNLTDEDMEFVKLYASLSDKDKRLIDAVLAVLVENAN